MHFSRTPPKITTGFPVGAIAFAGLPAFAAAVVRPVSAVFVELNGLAN